ncbi:hypothetical protein L6164_029760 [Bauhinia variegata]|uniref:Uncharacterized protein n=1 Tax=Bauhinia variegata TaxID=167791 RepID=A0ACB9LAL1_BAUVA|nr:hypothetical protein L6164_029760 [Bauhinia variegata]
MFYSHQLLARKAPLGQIWRAATMHAKINRRKLDKLNIIKICEEILNPTVPMALRLSGILMGKTSSSFSISVQLHILFPLRVELNESWKLKTVSDPTVLPKGKSQAKKEAVTLPENGETYDGEIEQSRQFSNTTATMGFQHTGYFTMRLDSVDEPYSSNGAREEDPSQHLHHVDTENITLFEQYESFQANADLYNRFERFDIEGDDETQPNFTSGAKTQTPTTPPFPPRQDDLPGGEQDEKDVTVFRQEQKAVFLLFYCFDFLNLNILFDKAYREIPNICYQHPGHQVNQQYDERGEARQDQERRGPVKRKRRQPTASAMDYEQTIVPCHIYQSWLRDASDIVSRSGRKKKCADLMHKMKIAKLMELPPVALIGDSLTNINQNIYYPSPILDLWIKSTHPTQDSPSERSSMPQPPEPSFSSPPGVGDFNGFPSDDLRGGLDSPLLGNKPETMRNNNLHAEILTNELMATLKNGLRVPEATPMVTPGNSGKGEHSIPSSLSDPGSYSHFDSGRIKILIFLKKKLGLIDDSVDRPKKRRHTSPSRNSMGGLSPVVEYEIERKAVPNYNLAPDQGPTQTQAKINYPVDKMTASIRAQMKAHFDTPGTAQVESLDSLSFGMTRKQAALLFYQTCVLVSCDALKVEQKEPYGEILISRGPKM